jgi:REP element-mobilizing transposase RayT
MPHTYSSTFVHCVFSTKGRAKTISTEIQSKLWPYIAGIARNHEFNAVAIGGTDDHMHVLLSLPPKIALAEAVQYIKGGSSKWVHDMWPEKKDFAWQQGYGAFSVGISHLEDTISYIHNQAEHHRRRDFQEEFLAFLKKHGIEYDPAHVWG